MCYNEMVANLSKNFNVPLLDKKFMCVMFKQNNVLFS